MPQSLRDKKNHIVFVDSSHERITNKKSFFSVAEGQHTSVDSGISWLRISFTADRPLTSSGVCHIVQVSFVFQ